MLPHPVASAEIAFGGATIFVKLYSSVVDRPPLFSSVHAGCGGTLRQELLCVRDGTVVERASVAKEYRHPSVGFVHFTEDEVRALDAPRPDGLEVREFRPRGTLDPLLFAASYLLGPDEERGGARAFATFVETLRRTNATGVGVLALAGRERLAAVEAYGERGLLLRELHHPGDVQAWTEVQSSGEHDPAVLAEWCEFVRGPGSAPFDLANHVDPFRERLREAVERKARVEGGAPAPVPLTHAALRKLAKAPRQSSRPPPSRARDAGE
jgi:DNA end-binding protein Ku